MQHLPMVLSPHQCGFQRILCGRVGIIINSCEVLLIILQRKVWRISGNPAVQWRGPMFLCRSRLWKKPIVCHSNVALFHNDIYVQINISGLKFPFFIFLWFLLQ